MATQRIGEDLPPLLSEAESHEEFRLGAAVTMTKGEQIVARLGFRHHRSIGIRKSHFNVAHRWSRYRE